MKRFWVFGVGLAVLFAGCVPASADLLYSESFTGSGNFDGTDFTSELVTLSILADPANVTSTGQSPNVWLLGGPLTVSVETLGSVLLTSTGGVVVNNGQGGVDAGEIGTSTDPNAPAFFGIRDSAFATYDLSTVFGPVTSDNTFGDGGSTSNGNLTISSNGVVTFQVTNSTPEPMTLSTVLGGLAVLALAYRRKRLARY